MVNGRPCQPMVKPVPVDRFRPVCTPKFTTAEKFIEIKLEMLRDDFCLCLTEEDIKYIKQFDTEHTINAAVKTIINRHWEV